MASTPGQGFSPVDSLEEAIQDLMDQPITRNCDLEKK